MFNINIQRTVSSQQRTFELDVCINTNKARIALYGPSGAGKSLTVQAIAGLLTPDQGYISINKNVLFDSSKNINQSPQQRHIAYLAQDYSLFPHLTVLQNIVFGLTNSWFNPRRRTKLPESASYWVNAFGLEGLLGNYPHQLSGGQKQRVALARALVTKPELIILDEPFAALDQGIKRKMRADLLNLQLTLNIPCILITHDIQDAQTLADTVFLMQNGEITGNTVPKANVEENVYGSGLPNTTEEALKIA